MTDHRQVEAAAQSAQIDNYSGTCNSCDTGKIYKCHSEMGSKFVLKSIIVQKKIKQTCSQNNNLAN